jgi:hypothetical protein
VTLQGIQTLAFPEGASHGLRWEEKIIMNKTVEIMDNSSVQAGSSKSTKGKGRAKQNNHASATEKDGRGRSTDVSPAAFSASESEAVPPVALPPGQMADPAHPLPDPPEQESSSALSANGGGPKPKVRATAPDVPTPATSTRHDGLHLEKGVHGYVSQWS